MNAGRDTYDKIDYYLVGDALYEKKDLEKLQLGYWVGGCFV